MFHKNHNIIIISKNFHAYMNTFIPPNIPIKLIMMIVHVHTFNVFRKTLHFWTNNSFCNTCGHDLLRT